MLPDFGAELCRGDTTWGLAVGTCWHGNQVRGVRVNVSALWITSWGIIPSNMLENISWGLGLVGRETAGLGQSPSASRWDPCPAAFSLPPFHQPSPPSLPLTLSCWDRPRRKKTAQFVMSCPAVNLPLPSHREDLLSSIYLFATRTMEGPRPAELFIITPPTIPPSTPPLRPAAPRRGAAGVSGH